MQSVFSLASEFDGIYEIKYNSTTIRYSLFCMCTGYYEPFLLFFKVN